MRWVRRIPEGLLSLFALPAYQLWHIAKYANTRRGRGSQDWRIHHLPTRDLHLQRDLGISLGRDAVGALARYRLGRRPGQW